jgi:hypothetical protein
VAKGNVEQMRGVPITLFRDRTHEPNIHFCSIHFIEGMFGIDALGWVASLWRPVFERDSRAMPNAFQNSRDLRGDHRLHDQPPTLIHKPPPRSCRGGHPIRYISHYPSGCSFPLALVDCFRTATAAYSKGAPFYNAWECFCFRTFGPAFRSSLFMGRFGFPQKTDNRAR